MAYTELTYNDNAITAIETINTNVGDDILDVSMNANAVVDAINAEYGAGTVLKSMNAVEFVDAMNLAFEQGDIPVVPTKGVFKFLHLSDSHGFAIALNRALTELNTDSTIDALLFTGDFTAHNGYVNAAGYEPYNVFNGSALSPNSPFTSAITASEVKAVFDNIKTTHGQKLLMVAGNHDAYDNPYGVGSVPNGTQQKATAAIKQWVTSGVVTWGDSSGVASFWHKDYTLSEDSKLRIIALDQYENTRVGSAGQYNYQPLYSQGQIDWLVQRLKELTSNDYLIIMLHEPAYQDDTAISGLKEDIGTNPQKLFLSERLSKFNYKGDSASINLLPRIMRNYLDGTSATWQHKNLNNGQTVVTVNADFANNTNQPAKFLFYIGGHRHCDIVTYLPPPFDNQMMMHIATSDWVVISSQDNDLLSKSQKNYNNSRSDKNVKQGNNADYVINKVTLDFDNGTVRIDRIGANQTLGKWNEDDTTYIPNGSRNRNNVTFTI